MTMTYKDAALKWRARLPLSVGYTALALLLGVIGGWSVLTVISGAVVASGTLEVAGHKQVVQHPSGGVVGRIDVRDGDRIRAGDILVRLDDRFLRSELAVIESQLVELMARKARLEAERDGADSITFPPALEDFRKTVPGAATQIEGQTRLFHARLASLETEKEQIDEQIAQIGHQIEGTDAQISAAKEQSDFIGNDLANAELLLKKSLIQASRVNDLRGSAAGLKGQIGRLIAQTADLRGQISALKIQKVKLGNARREDASALLRDLAAQEVELAENRFAKLEILAQLDIRAPVDGIIYGSKVFALQSVIQPAEPIMYVVPQEQDLIVNARIESTSVDQVSLGQETRLRLSAFDQRTTPELKGRVLTLSADAFKDEATGQSYFQAVVAPEPGEVALLEGRALVPGMPVQVLFRTEDRTPFSYFVKPMSDYFTKAFRE